MLGCRIPVDGQRRRSDLRCCPATLESLPRLSERRSTPRGPQLLAAQLTLRDHHTIIVGIIYASLASSSIAQPRPSLLACYASAHHRTNMDDGFTYVERKKLPKKQRKGKQPMQLSLVERIEQRRGQRKAFAGTCAGASHTLNLAFEA